MTTVIRITEEDFESAIDIARPILQSGGIIIYPTDTVYGIGCDATNEEAVKKIHKIKGIPEERPMSVMVSDFGMIEYYCATGLWEDLILKRYLPGPYTFVLNKSRPLPASQTDKLGIRLPDSVFCQALCQKFGRPIVSTSANTTGKDASGLFVSVEQEIIDAADLAIDGGPTKYGNASVVIDLVDRKMIRRGGKEISLIEIPEP
jgi:tRNA threonylcarbamoyl adenosine modification protein (Sua5/YciO/YrdC/YwlC family)